MRDRRRSLAEQAVEDLELGFEPAADGLDGGVCIDPKRVFLGQLADGAGFQAGGRVEEDKDFGPANRGLR
jgi:hypothetical protein